MRLKVNKRAENHREIELIIQCILKELVNEFGKTKTEAMEMIKKTEVKKSLLNEEIGFHESPYNWAISILTILNDVEALEKHFYH